MLGLNGFSGNFFRRGENRLKIHSGGFRQFFDAFIFRIASSTK